MEKYKRVMTIAGSDSGGGAGIQIDLKTIFALGCYGTSVITALTAQNTIGVQDILAIPVSFILQQFKSVMEDIGTDVIKIGMLHRKEVVEQIADALYLYNTKVPIVLDPVMIAKAGKNLLDKDALYVMKNKLFPLVTLITPNLHEAEILLERNITTKSEMQEAAISLSKVASNVLIKGGHLTGKIASDCFYFKQEDTVFWFENERISTANDHGTGCTLSSAIASYLALGYSLFDAVQKANYYVNLALSRGQSYSIGQGHGPLYHYCP